MLSINRTMFFDLVRAKPFGGSLTQDQVDGMNFKIDAWLRRYAIEDRRWLAYALATSFHETGRQMVPVREGFKKTDAAARKFVKDQGYEYAAVDVVTQQVYYGRGDIQVTWAENYKKVGVMLDMGDVLYRNPDQMLDVTISAMALLEGMKQGIYRRDAKGPHKFERYFNPSLSDPYNAREIVNGDKARVPKNSKITIGRMIEGYYRDFLAALNASMTITPDPVPDDKVVEMALSVPEGVTVKLTINGKDVSIA